MAICQRWSRLTSPFSRCSPKSQDDAFGQLSPYKFSRCAGQEHLAAVPRRHDTLGAGETVPLGRSVINRSFVQPFQHRPSARRVGNGLHVFEHRQRMLEVGVRRRRVCA